MKCGNAIIEIQIISCLAVFTVHQPSLCQRACASIGFNKIYLKEIYIQKMKTIGDYVMIDKRGQKSMQVLEAKKNQTVILLSPHGSYKSLY